MKGPNELLNRSIEAVLIKEISGCFKVPLDPLSLGWILDGKSDGVPGFEELIWACYVLDVFEITRLKLSVAALLE